MTVVRDDNGTVVTEVGWEVCGIPIISAQLRSPSSQHNKVLLALAGAVAGPSLRGAVAGFGHLAIRTDTGLGVHAPEQSIVRSLYVGIGLRQNKLPFPAKRGAEIRLARIEAIAIANHATPPAFRMARFTATRAS